ncbi:hypothetical protein LZ30DRAFT_558246, partial [Colletotrichum cereale]
VRCGSSPWEINFDLNRRQSRILRLPDELLLRIMKLADTADLYMLRQASFTFWRIYQGEDFDKFHRVLGTFHDMWRVGFRNDKTTVLRAQQQAFCARCLQRRTSPDYESDKLAFGFWGDEIHCSHCRTPHKRMAFSVQQRHLPAEVRRCISSYGFFRLCPHLMVSTHSIWRTAREILNGKHKSTSACTKVDIGCCSQCKDLGFQDTPFLDRWRVEPPTFTLANYEDGRNPPTFYSSRKWTLPFGTVPQGDAFTVAFLLQKQEEFKNRYGD